MEPYKTAEEVLNTVWGVVEFAGFEKCPSIDSVGIFGNTPLQVVITWGDLTAVKLLVEDGADINVRLEDGYTPLHYAISMGHFDIARYLVKLGARKDVRNDDGKLPRDLCWEGEWTGIFGARSA